MSFVIGNFRALEPAESGQGHSDVHQFRGEDLTSGLAVMMTVLDAERADDVRSMVTEIGKVRHPHLLAVDQVVQDADRVAVICRWPSGGRLISLLDRRNPLTVGETLTVLIPLASALTAIHRAGARHGDLGPATIWFEPAGRPMLGAAGAAGGVLFGRRGLPSQIRDVAPEVVRGQRPAGIAVTPAADIFSLGSVALRCLTGRPAWPADEPADVLVQSAAGLWPDLPGEAAPPAFVTLIRAMLQWDAAHRPSADEVVAGLSAVGRPEPVQLGPVRAAESSSRWRGWGDPKAQPDAAAGPPTTDNQSASRGVSGSPEDVSDPPAIDDDPRADVPSLPQPPGRLARAGIAVLVALLAVVVAVQVGLWWTGRDQPGASVGDGSGVSGAVPPDKSAVDWLQVVTDLDMARARAFALADATTLSEVYVPDSVPALNDAATIADLASRGWTVPGGVHDIASVAVDPAVPVAADPGAVAAEGDAVRVSVRDSLPARPIVDSTGQQVGLTVARPEQQRILTLRPTSAGYRISAVELR